ncbi:hypothetical protein [Pseudomonas akapageensis]|uniref:hypothetical protein n=1 Tax=Pseudomonas akapageensis TaxID=2609961 RepID=UPI00140CDB15|nr:hypothetical protein [Pseudomonas akapageensis]
MNNRKLGISGICTHCRNKLELASWQINAIAIRVDIVCPHCNQPLGLKCSRQRKALKNLDHLTTLRVSMLIFTASSMLVALVLEWIGLISVLAQLNFSLIMFYLYLYTLRRTREKHRLTLTLQAGGKKSQAQ